MQIKKIKKNIRMKKEKDIDKILWDKFINTQYHVEFFEWLSENYDIKPKNKKSQIERTPYDLSRAKPKK